MMISRTLAEGRKWGPAVVYTLEKKGDCFPTHTHTVSDNHITIVLFGRVKLLGHPDHAGKIIESQPGGTIIAWTAGEEHGFEADVDGTTFLNIRYD